MKYTQQFDKFIHALRQVDRGSANDENQIMFDISQVMEKFVSLKMLGDLSPFKNIDATVGFKKYCLHEEADHTLAVFLTAWLPQSISAPHTHGTWAVLTSLSGVETHTFWKNIDTKKSTCTARLTKEKVQNCEPGQQLRLGSNEIHSVANQSDRVILTLQVYGKSIEHTKRLRFE